MRLNPFVKYHLPVILFCLALFIQSSLPAVELPESNTIGMDKVAHFTAYGILFLLFFYSLKNQNKSVKLRTYSLEFAFLFTVLYGISDEIHQSFVTYRSADFFDAIADFLGALFVYIIMKIITQRKAKTLVSGFLFLLTVLLVGCSATPGEDSEDEESYNARKRILNVNLDIFTDDVEAWYDLMPVVEPDKENFRFLVQITINKLENSFIEMDTRNFFITNFRIVFPDYTVKRKKITVEFFKNSDRSIQIKMYHDLKAKYIDKTKPLPTEVEFHFDLDYGNELLKRIKTQKVEIKKVY